MQCSLSYEIRITVNRGIDVKNAGIDRSFSREVEETETEREREKLDIESCPTTYRYYLSRIIRIPGQDVA